jgi:hypothetical protein
METSNRINLGILAATLLVGGVSAGVAVWAARRALAEQRRATGAADRSARAAEAAARATEKVAEIEGQRHTDEAIQSQSACLAARVDEKHGRMKVTHSVIIANAGEAAARNIAMTVAGVPINEIQGIARKLQPNDVIGPHSQLRLDMSFGSPRPTGLARLEWDDGTAVRQSAETTL